MADDFFDKSETKTEEASTETSEEPEAIKVGDKAYTQEELSKLVQLGEIGKEAEEKYNVKIDKIWPNHQQTINEKKALEAEIENLKQAKAATKVEAGVDLTPDEIRVQARKEAKTLGIVLDEDIDARVNQILEFKELKADTLAVVAEAEEKYGIKTDEDALVQHMIATGIKNPQKAFKDLYEEKIDVWKEQQIEKLRKPGMVTDSSSNAGAKQPSAEPVTKENFFARMDAILDRQT